jgi:hypothetical protein
MRIKNKFAFFFIWLLSILLILTNNYYLITISFSKFSLQNQNIHNAHISKGLNTVYKNLKDQKDFFKDQIKTILTYYYKNDTMINRKEFLQQIETFSSGFNERSKFVLKYKSIR